MVFILDVSFNKDVFIQFNSTVGVFVGYTEFGVRNAQRLNSDTALLEGLRGQVNAYCKPNTKTFQDSVLDKVGKCHKHVQVYYSLHKSTN